MRKSVALIIAVLLPWLHGAAVAQTSIDEIRARAKQRAEETQAHTQNTLDALQAGAKQRADEERVQREEREKTASVRGKLYDDFKKVIVLKEHTCANLADAFRYDAIRSLEPIDDASAEQVPEIYSRCIKQAEDLEALGGVPIGLEKVLMDLQDRANEFPARHRQYAANQATAAARKKEEQEAQQKAEDAKERELEAAFVIKFQPPSEASKDCMEFVKTSKWPFWHVDLKRLTLTSASDPYRLKGVEVIDLYGVAADAFLEKDRKIAITCAFIAAGAPVDAFLKDR